METTIAPADCPCAKGIRHIAGAVGVPADTTRGMRAKTVIARRPHIFVTNGMLRATSDIQQKPNLFIYGIWTPILHE